MRRAWLPRWLARRAPTFCLKDGEHERARWLVPNFRQDALRPHSLPVKRNTARGAEIAQRMADARVQLGGYFLAGGANRLVFDEDATAVSPLVPPDARAKLLAGLVGAHLSFDHVETMAVLVRAWRISRQGHNLAGRRNH